MRVIICDDLKQEIAHYQNTIEEIAKHMDISISVKTYTSAKQMMFEQEDDIDTIDVLVLDINMPDVSGLDIAEKLRRKNFKGEIIFITISEDHMLKAFDLRAFNYIIKQKTSKEREYSIFRSVFNIVEEKNKEYIRFTGIGEYRNIPLTSIKYFEVNGKIVTIYYGNKTFEVVSTLGKIETIIFNKGFIRIHRSYIVSKWAIKSFSFKELELIDGTVLSVGRKYYQSIKMELDKKS